MSKLVNSLVYIVSMMFLISDIAYASQPSYSIKEALLKLVFYIIVIIFVLVLTIFSTRLFAKKSQRFIQSKYMKIVDVLNVGANIKILMIEINKIIYAVVVANNSVEVIEKIKKEELIEKGDFEDKLNRYTFNYKNLHNIKKALSKYNKLSSEEDENEDEN